MTKSTFKGSVVFIGLDEMSLKLAAKLIRSGYITQTFEKESPFVSDFQNLGGQLCLKSTETGIDITAVVLLIRNDDEITASLNACKNITGGLPKEAVVILRTTILPPNVKNVEKLLIEEYGATYIVDAYATEGMSDILNGKIMIASSGNSEALSKAKPILSSMSEKLHNFEGDIGAGSKIKMVNELLESIHVVASVEAIALGARAGIHPWIIFQIISNAAGSSRIFKLQVPELLQERSKLGCLSDKIASLEAILNFGKMLPFPLPILSAAHGQMIACVSGNRNDADTTQLKMWESVYRVNIRDPANSDLYNPELLGNQLISNSENVKTIGFIGLGAMGFGMAAHLLKSNYIVKGFDVSPLALSRFTNVGGMIGNTPADVCEDIDVLIIMVANEAQAENVLFGDFGAVSVLKPGASIILSSTVSPGYMSRIEPQLMNGKTLKLIDAPVSGGVKKASEGALTIMASGKEEALRSVGTVLSALSEKLYIIKGGCGAASGVKMVNQLLAGVHIAAAAESMAFGARLGLATRKLFDYILHSGGFSWMFENRVPHMLDNDYTPYSALDIFVKDLGIVCHESSMLDVALHVSRSALQLFVSGSASGCGREDDAGVVKVYEKLTGVKVGGHVPGLQKDAILTSLPPEWPSDLIDDICQLNQTNHKTLVVLDDDPTGTQTVHDIDVLTEWSVESLVDQFNLKPVCFFILTNSRSLSSDKATELVKSICTNLKAAAKIANNVDFTVVLRGDSTLRGHFPEEPDAVTSVLGEMDTWIICPFFLQGGRFTIGNVHYVADMDRLIPAGETEFAKDSTFGYTSSDLCQWVEEKTKGRTLASSFATISIQLLRKGGPNAVCEALCNLPKGSICIVNSASDRDMQVFSAGMIQAEMKGKSFLCRTAASFVSSRAGIAARTPLLPKDVGVKLERNGGLIVVGSYVSKTTKQVEELKNQCGEMIKSIEVNAEKLCMNSFQEREEELSRVVEMADLYLSSQRDTLIVTSRELIVGKTSSESLEIVAKVSCAVVEIVKRITTKPRYIIAKGGITSSDVATKALEAKRAKVLGQALAGVPLWLLGSESRHPKVPYIVFPGNVGDSKALAEVVKTWALTPTIASTKDLLMNADKEGYALGAFNIYNMEGVEAVVAAAEEENSPAIIQIHPTALRSGGIPLVACCLSAAQQASVPITVHFDHGTDRKEILKAIEMGFDSIMVDASHLPIDENISCTKFVASIAHTKNMLVEAELGRLSGTEDGITVEAFEACFTDIKQAEKFMDETGIDALAVCIGNVHGKYPPSGPNLRLDLLEELHGLSSKKGVILVLHGASGLDQGLIKSCIQRGVRKFNVNTEVRKAYLDAISAPDKDLLHLMDSAKLAMKHVIVQKMRLFGSSGKAFC